MAALESTRPQPQHSGCHPLAGMLHHLQYMSSSRLLKTSRRYFHAFGFDKIRRSFPRIQPALRERVARLPGDAFRSRTIRWSNSAAVKSCASASLLVSVTGFLIWNFDSNSPSNEASQFGYYKVLQENAFESSNHITDLGSKPPPSNIAFTYPQLSEDKKTRLIILEPGEPDDELRCHLKHICSLQDHEYEALSYVWGVKSKTHAIECSGMKIQVTANLDAALRQLRSANRPRVLWIVAICINQDDKVERNRQVRIMQEIYANAT